MESQFMVFLERSLGEATDLLAQSRAFAMQMEAGSIVVSDGSLMGFHAASMRLAARLAEVMAWLLAQKAADAGEITLEQAVSPAFALSRLAICKDAAGEEDESLPAGFRHMLLHSRLLYERVERLDEQLHGGVGT